MTSQHSLSGKTALVTGSTSGIGLAIAHSLARAGASVMLNGFGSADDIRVAVEGVKHEHGGKVAYHPADDSKPDAVRAMVAAAEQELGPVQILVNNVGVQHVEAMVTFPDAQWEKIIALNLSSAFYATKAVIPAITAHGWGRIINIASVHGLIASPFKSAYVAAKHGLVGLTKVTALELAGVGATCNAICPGYVETPLVQQQIPEQAKARGISEAEVRDRVFLEHHAIKAFVTTDQIAALALYLCSDAAATLTGVALPVDCGWVAA
jgi:3-hydroxybutyrate dehydrogenase